MSNRQRQQHQYRRQTKITLPLELKIEAQTKAIRNHISLSTYIEQLIAADLQSPPEGPNETKENIQT